MRERNSFEKVDRSWLANPEQGRAYLKTALEFGDDRFLSALHAVMDSVIDAEFNSDLELQVLPIKENIKAA